MPTKTTKALGDEYEQLAKNYLIKAGLVAVIDNFHSRFGEIDLIMLERDTLVFIEVRARKNNHYGGAFASVTAQKQHKISLTAQYFLSLHPEHQLRDCRFDVVALSQLEQVPAIDWLKNAFME